MTYTAPPFGLAMPVWITHASRVSRGLDNQFLATLAAADASTAWGTINLALYIPFEANMPFWVRRIGWHNGATASGNVDVGLYDAVDGLPVNRLISSGSTAQTGTSVLQVVDVTDTLFAAGSYFIGMAASSATATFMATPMTSVLRGRWAGCAQEASALPLPATATPVQFATASFLPYGGLCQRSLA